MAPLAQGLGPSERVAVYRIGDDDLAVGSTLGGQKVVAIAKATGAIQRVFSVDVGKNLLGTVLWRFYDACSETRLMQEHTGEFLIHPEHQEHLYGLPGGLGVHETFFVLRTADLDPPAVYISIEVENTGDEQRDLAAYLFADLCGDTEGDVEATYDAGLRALIAWNHAHRDWVRLVGCSERPYSVETTIDAAKAVDAHFPGDLSDTTEATGKPLGVLHLRHRLEPGGRWSFSFLLTVGGAGRRAARAAHRRCPPADKALARTKEFYHDVLSQAVVVTPNPMVNRGILWAKANMLRVQTLSPTGWAFTNDPTRSNNSVGRDTAWFAYGADYITPAFSREALLAYVRLQEKCGKIIEYYDIRDGRTEDYGLNINDNTPLLILALWHHYNVTGDGDFLRQIYPAAFKAARYILSQRNEQGLVWCTATGTADWGIIGWRNVISGYQLNGATTEVNSECYAALKVMSSMARVLEQHEESATFLAEAEALRQAINTHLYNPRNGLYYLNIDLEGRAHSDVTSDLVFPVMFGVAPDDVCIRIINRLNDHDFWTEAGMRTTPRDAPSYTPDGAWGLLGGVWVGVSFWYAFAAARYTPEFMDNALAISFHNYSVDPRKNNTVPGQFSEWLHGETLVNEGMMLSPWYPPRYLWAAIEGAARFEPSLDGPGVRARLGPDWKWLGVRNLPYHGKRLTWFTARLPDLRIYTNFPCHGDVQYTAYEEDVSDRVQASGDSITTIGLRQGDNLVVFVGNTADRTVGTAVRVRESLVGQYRVRTFHSIVGDWQEGDLVPAERVMAGLTMQIERKGFRVIELRQEV